MKSLGALILLSCVGGCSNAPESTSTTVRFNEHSAVVAAVARTEREQVAGLMFRSQIGPNEGMLFVFAEPRDVCMWMKNTPVALSVAFLDSNGRIINVADMEPNSEAPHCAAKPVAYALEVNRGWFKQHQLGAGDQGSIGL